MVSIGNKMIRVAFVLENNGWLGGVNYFRNLFSALDLISECKIKPVLFVGYKTPENILQYFNKNEVIATTIKFE